MGSRSELAIRRKHRPVGQLRHSGTKFNPRQHDRPGQYCHAASRHNSDYSRFDIAEWDFSECDGPGLYVPQRDAQPSNARIHEPRLDRAKYDHSGLDFAERYSEYDQPRLDIAQRNAEHHDSGIHFAQRDTEHHDPWIEFAQRYTKHDDPWIDFAANHHSG